MLSALILTCLFLSPALAATPGADSVQPVIHNLTGTPVGLAALVIFIAALLFVVLEEKLQLPKSGPVLVAAGIIWAMVSITYNQMGDIYSAHKAIQNNLLEYAELLLVLLVAIIYINSMEERNVFQRLRVWLACKGFSLRTVFWLTGLLAFFISPVADNLTTALLLGAVAMAVGGKNRKFVILSCINIVAAANAGGAPSPFGDTTTLMVFQKNLVKFHKFFFIFLPLAINWLIPAAVMNFAIGKERTEEICETLKMRIGARRIILLFLITIATAVIFRNYLHLPPACGMMLGLGWLWIFSFWLNKKEQRMEDSDPVLGSRNGEFPHPPDLKMSHFYLMRNVSRAEWGTLLFFYGVILCVGGLTQFGYLARVSAFLYHGPGTTFSNVMVGILSAIGGNILVMYAVLSMSPDTAHGQWLHSYLKWIPVIALGYVAGILCQL